METGFWTQMTYGMPTPIDKRNFSYERNSVEHENVTKKYVLNGSVSVTKEGFELPDDEEEKKKQEEDKVPNLKRNSIQPSACHSGKKYEPLLTRRVSLDCEMVGTGPKGHQYVLGRVCVVNELGTVILNKFVKPVEKVTKYYTALSGIRASDLKDAEHFSDVSMEVAAILSGRIVIGHDLVNDFRVLGLDIKLYELRDTANYRPIVWTAGEFNVPKLKLKKLVQTLLGYQIQVGEHCPAEDAQAAMHLYKKFQVGWDEFLSRKTKPRKHYEPPNNLPIFRLTNYLAMYCTSTASANTVYVALVSQNGEFVFHDIVDRNNMSAQWQMLEVFCKDRILVGHDLENTLKEANWLPESVRKCKIHDVAILSKFADSKQVSSLTSLAEALLNLRIEEGDTKDGAFNALAVMHLFMKFRTEWPPEVHG